MLGKFFSAIDETFVGLVKKVTKNKVKEQKVFFLLQFVKFGIVGLSNSVINYLVYVISLALLQKYKILVAYECYISQILAFLISVLWAFYWNKLYVFKGEGKSKKDIFLELGRSYISYGITGLVLSEILLYLWVEKIRMSVYIAPVVNIIICLPINFILNKFWTFHKEYK